MMTRAERRTHWRTIIEDQATSGLNVSAFCRERQISPDLFYAWRRRFREQPSCPGGFLQLIPDRAVETCSGIRIHPGRKLFIEVDRGFDPFTLRAVVGTLRMISPCSA